MGTSEQPSNARDQLIYGVVSVTDEGVIGAGCVTMAYERRGDFQRLWRGVRERPDAPKRVTWRKVKKKHLPFFAAIVDELLGRGWLAFHGAVGYLQPGGEPQTAAAAQLAALVAHAGRMTPPRSGHRLRLAGEAGGGPPVDRRSAPALQLADLLLSVWLAAHGGGVKSRAKRKLIRLVVSHPGVRIWPPEDL